MRDEDRQVQLVAITGFPLRTPESYGPCTSYESVVVEEPWLLSDPLVRHRRFAPL
jgi:hypothetical protein